MPNPSKLRVGIIGAGQITSSVHLPVLCASNQMFDVRWIYDVNLKSNNEIARQFRITPLAQLDNQSAVEHIDIVLLATPVFARRDYLMLCAERQVHVLVEKPFALTASEHVDYVSLFTASRIYCGYMRRVYKTTMILKKFIDWGTFGHLKKVTYQEGGRTTSASGNSKTLDLPHTSGGGVLRDLGCHGIDLLLYLTGATDFAVEKKSIEWDDETDREVSADLILKNPYDGREIETSFLVSWLNSTPNEIIFEFDTTDIKIGIKPDSEMLLRDRKHEGDWYSLNIDINGAVSPYQAFYLEWLNVFRNITTDAPSEFLATKCRSTTELVDLIYSANK